jgi:hypothetical protein
MTTTEENIEQSLKEYGFSLETSEASPGDNRLDYGITLKFNGKSVLTTEYHLGLGFVKIAEVKSERFWLRPGRLTNDEGCMFAAWKKKPYADFKDKALQTAVAVKIANAKNLRPTLPDVVHSLLMDGTAFFDAATFEQWASDFGYDADSRKAEAIYKACDNIGRTLASKIDAETLAKARKLLEDY